MVTVSPARVEWLAALVAGDDVFTQRFGIPVVAGWVGFPESLPYALEGTRAAPDDVWGTHLFFDDADGALVGFGGWKGAPVDGTAELGYAIAPARQGRGLATAVVATLVERARAAGVKVVTAHTLGAPNASTAVLVTSGFARGADVADAELGTIWRWEKALGLC